MGDREDRLAQAQAALAAAVEKITTGEDWQAWLATMSKFHHYSARNALWLSCQGAQRGIAVSRFAGYRSWQALGQQVRKGERGYTVFAPMVVKAKLTDAEVAAGIKEPQRKLVGFRLATVFDVSQVDGPPLPGASTRPRILDDGEAVHDPSAIISAIERRGFSVELADSVAIGGANGMTSFTAQTVQVRADLPSAQRTKTLAHELAHIALDHEHRAEVPRERAEVEAESVAYLLCSELGLDSAAYTYGYVSHWAGGDQALVLATAERVRGTSALLLDELAPMEEHEAIDERDDELAQTA